MELFEYICFSALFLCIISVIIYMLHLFFFRGRGDHTFVRFRGAHIIYISTVLTDKLPYNVFIEQFQKLYEIDGTPENISIKDLKELGEKKSAYCKVLYYLNNHRPTVEKYFNTKKMIKYKSYLALKKEAGEVTINDVNNYESILVTPLSDNQYKSLAECVNECYIFDKKVTWEELKNTFNCNISLLANRLKPKNNREFAVFLDVLDKYNIINKDWQSFIERHELFYSSSKNGTKYLTSSDLASALYKSSIIDTGRNKEDKYKILREKIVEHIQEMKSA